MTVATTYKAVADWAAEPGLKIRHRVDAGGRRLLVCIHGSGGSPLDWMPDAVPQFAGAKDYLVTRPLAKRAATPIAVDAGGPTNWASDTVAMPAIDAAVDALRGSRRAVLLGHSMGTVCATRYAALHPDKVAGLILFSGALNMDADYVQGGSFPAAMDAAWGGSYANNCAALHKRPFDYAPALKMPVRQIVSSGDASFIVDATAAFDALLGSRNKQRLVVPGTGNVFTDHVETPFTYTDVDELVRFVLDLSDTAEEARAVRVGYGERDEDGELRRFAQAAGVAVGGVVAYGPRNLTVDVADELRGGQILTADPYLAARLEQLDALEEVAV